MTSLFINNYYSGSVLNYKICDTYDALSSETNSTAVLHEWKPCTLCHARSTWQSFEILFRTTWDNNISVGFTIYMLHMAGTLHTEFLVHWKFSVSWLSSGYPIQCAWSCFIVCTDFLITTDVAQCQCLQWHVVWLVMKVTVWFVHHCNSC